MGKSCLNQRSAKLLLGDRWPLRTHRQPPYTYAICSNMVTARSPLKCSPTCLASTYRAKV